jgi:hypothetical protein
MLAFFLVVRMPTITTRNLDEDVKQKLRVLAAQHGRSMEAKARAILTREVQRETAVDPPATERFRGLVGRWKGRSSTDVLMNGLRGED